MIYPNAATAAAFDVPSSVSSEVGAVADMRVQFLSPCSVLSRDAAAAPQPDLGLSQGGPHRNKTDDLGPGHLSKSW
jgi:hypothetical protein